MTTAKILGVFALAAALAGFSASPAPAAGPQIKFASELEEAGRAQLRRLLADYDLSPWLFTDKVKVEAGVEPHSMPILTMNTDHLDNDLRQLSIFLHEQVHWHVAMAARRLAAIAELRRAYPDAPADSERLYQHLLVAWLEFDALAELIGEDEARRVIREKVAVINRGLAPEVAEQFAWYNLTVLEDTQAIGAVVERHGLMLTPGAGITLRRGP